MIFWLIASVIIIVTWETLAHFVAEGWILALINIFFMLVTFAVGAFGYLPILQKRMSKTLAFLLSIVLWIIIFVVVRSLLFPAG